MTGWELAAVWVGSIGTVLAFLVAIVVFGVSAADRQRAHARLVLGYVSEGRIAYSKGTRIADMRGGPKATRSFGGGLVSSLSITDAVLLKDVNTFQWTLTNNSDEMLGRTRLVLIDEGGRETLKLTAKHYVLPGTSESLHLVLPSEETPKGHLRAEVHFKDAVGRTWMRLEGERLRRVWRPSRKRIDVPERPSGTWKPAGIPGIPQVRVFEADTE